MSRSRPSTRNVNPSVRFYEWVGSTGQVKYWDKDKKEEVYEDLPKHFIVLDQLHTIVGFSDAHKTSFWSNEVRDISKYPVRVSLHKKGLQREGIWTDIKGDKALTGASYGRSVYIMMKIDGQWQICNIKLAGSALGPWFDLNNLHNVETGGVSLVDALPAQKGTNHYFVPVFRFKETIDDTVEAKAVELDALLQTYLDAYLAAPPTSQDVSGNGEQQSQQPQDNIRANANEGSNVAKDENDLITAKQLGGIRSWARSAGVDAETECLRVMRCKPEELSKNSASAFIGHLQDLINQNAGVQQHPVDTVPEYTGPPLNEAELAQTKSGETETVQAADDFDEFTTAEEAQAAQSQAKPLEGDGFSEKGPNEQPKESGQSKAAAPPTDDDVPF